MRRIRERLARWPDIEKLNLLEDVRIGLLEEILLEDRVLVMVRQESFREGETLVVLDLIGVLGDDPVPLA